MIVTKHSDQFKTDDWLMKLFEGWFDPCPLNNNPTIDGLLIDWKHKTFVNPPYSNPKDWVKKAILESTKGHTIVMLLKFDCTTQWYRMLLDHGAHFLYVGERLKHGTGKKAAFPSMLVIL